MIIYREGGIYHAIQRKGVHCYAFSPIKEEAKRWCEMLIEEALKEKQEKPSWKEAEHG